MEALRAAVLIAAVLTMGVMAGVFQLYAYAIMPALRRVEDRTFVGAFQAVDRAIINPLFMVNFLGALVCAAAAALLHVTSGERAVLPWAAAAFVLYLIVVIITGAVHLPRNDAIKAAGDVDVIADFRGVRTRFGETTWHRWNVVRALLTTAAAGCLGWALVEFGRI